MEEEIAKVRSEKTPSATAARSAKMLSLEIQELSQQDQVQALKNLADNQYAYFQKQLEERNDLPENYGAVLSQAKQKFDFDVKSFDSRSSIPQPPETLSPANFELWKKEMVSYMQRFEDKMDTARLEHNKRIQRELLEARNVTKRNEAAIADVQKTLVGAINNAPNYKFEVPFLELLSKFNESLKEISRDENTETDTHFLYGPDIKPIHDWNSAVEQIVGSTLTEFEKLKSLELEVGRESAALDREVKSQSSEEPSALPLEVPIKPESPIASQTPKAHAPDHVANKAPVIEPKGHHDTVIAEPVQNQSSLALAKEKMHRLKQFEPHRESTATLEEALSSYAGTPTSFIRSQTYQAIQKQVFIEAGNIKFNASYKESERSHLKMKQSAIESRYALLLEKLSEEQRGIWGDQIMALKNEINPHKDNLRNYDDRELEIWIDCVNVYIHQYQAILDV